jgi:hypothetical protein
MLRNEASTFVPGTVPMLLCDRIRLFFFRNLANARMGSVWKRLNHINKRASKFRFTASYQVSNYYYASSVIFITVPISLGGNVC